MPARILVVDDEPQLERLILQRFRKKIREKEYQFDFAQNGLEALDKLQQNGDFDIVLTDINMPKMDGLTFITKLNEINSFLKAVIVSAYGDLKNIRSAMNYGAYDFVTKPIDFEDLQTTINKALKEIEILKLAALARKELSYIQQELNVASEIQQSILPKNFTIFSEGSPIEMCAEMIPATEVGGDFYDFFKFDNNRLGFVIGDVSGKGMPAALFMAICRTLLKAIALKGEPVNECVNQVNYLLSLDNPKCMFVTLIYGVLNMNTGEVEYCNGGHNAPCLLSSDGEMKFFKQNRNSALGVIEDLEYKSNSIHLESGSSLILYTDGIPEAINKNSEGFSDERFIKYLKKCKNFSPKEITKGLINEVKAFSADTPQSDDITILIIKNNG